MRDEEVKENSNLNDVTADGQDGGQPEGEPAAAKKEEDRQESSESVQDTDDNDIEITLVDEIPEASGYTKQSAPVRKHRAGKIICMVFLALLLLAAVAYGAMTWHFRDRFFYQTTINGIDFSGQTVADVQAKLTEEVSRYSLQLQERNGVWETIRGQDIGLVLEFETSFDEMQKQQNMFLWFLGLFEKTDYTVGSSLHYDEQKLSSVVTALNVLNPTLMIEPSDATVEFDGENYVLNPGEIGTKVQEDVFYACLNDAIMNLKPQLSLEEAGCYVAQNVSADDPAIVQCVETLNLYSHAQITYQIWDQTESCPAETIRSWLSIGEGFEVVIDSDLVRDYIDTLGDKYNTYGTTRSFTTTGGNTVEITKGDYGWRMNRADTTEELIAAVKEGGSHEMTPLWLQEANSRSSQDWGNTYVEINLSAQHLYFYKDGALVVESDFVSGNMSKGYDTPGGIYSLKYKQSPAVLRGDIQPDGSYGYESPVTYWMPFNGGVGMHDASWRSTFGGNIYLSNGSHGCINLPISAAKKIYENISSGTPVICFY